MSKYTYANTINSTITKITYHTKCFKIKARLSSLIISFNISNETYE